jgi:hypothetical protein
MNIKRLVLKFRLFFSTIFVRYEQKQERGFVYEFDDERFKKLTPEEQGVQVQKNWNKYMKDK